MGGLILLITCCACACACACAYLMIKSASVSCVIHNVILWVTVWHPVTWSYLCTILTAYTEVRVIEMLVPCGKAADDEPMIQSKILTQQENWTHSSDSATLGWDRQTNYLHCTEKASTSLVTYSLTVCSVWLQHCTGQRWQHTESHWLKLTPSCIQQWCMKKPCSPDSWQLHISFLFMSNATCLGHSLLIATLQYLGHAVGGQKGTRFFILICVPKCWCWN